MSHLHLKALLANEFSAKDLVYTVFVPLLESDPPDRFAGQSGWLSLDVTGDKGGQWSLDLDGGEVFEGGHPDPDCHLQLSLAAFGDLVRGRLQAEQALDEGDLKVHGDVDVLVRLSELLMKTEGMA